MGAGIAEPERLVAEIATGSGRTREEVRLLMDAKREKFSGLLTEAGAAIMVARELGIGLNGTRPANTRIGELKEGMNNVDVMALVKRAFPPKQYEKNGRKGQLQNIILTDGTGEIRATLWNGDIKKFAALEHGYGKALQLENCRVTSYNGTLQLALNYNSAMSLSENSGLHEEPKKTAKLEELEHGMNYVCVEVLLKKTFSAREFENERGKGKVLNFIITQGTEEMRATAWNAMCDAVEVIGEGEKVLIEGAYVKENRGTLELHLGNTARIGISTTRQKST